MLSSVDVRETCVSHSAEPLAPQARLEVPFDAIGASPGVMVPVCMGITVRQVAAPSRSGGILAGARFRSRLS